VKSLPAVIRVSCPVKLSVVVTVHSATLLT